LSKFIRVRAVDLNKIHPRSNSSQGFE